MFDYGSTRENIHTRVVDIWYSEATWKNLRNIKIPKGDKFTFEPGG